jgi:hypothetical protein
VSRGVSRVAVSVVVKVRDRQCDLPSTSSRYAKRVRRRVSKRSERLLCECIMFLFSEKFFEVFQNPSGLFFYDPVSAVVDHAPLFRLREPLKLFEGAHRIIE